MARINSVQKTPKNLITTITMKCNEFPKKRKAEKKPAHAAIQGWDELFRNKKYPRLSKEKIQRWK
jgi:hypothetical protein